MAGVPAAVSLDAALSRKAQEAALLMMANEQLSHYPPADWKCYSSGGAEAAGRSNLSLGNKGAAAVASQMRDAGKGNGGAGHRRWLLYPHTRTMGAGDVDYLSEDPFWCASAAASAPATQRCQPCIGGRPIHPSCLGALHRLVGGCTGSAAWRRAGTVTARAVAPHLHPPPLGVRLN